MLLKKLGKCFAGISFTLKFSGYISVYSNLLPNMFWCIILMGIFFTNAADYRSLYAPNPRWCRELMDGLLAFQAWDPTNLPAA